MADRVEVNPKILKWSRETARISLEVAAAKVSVSEEKLTEWESGKSLPTVRQAQTLAKAYKRPFALLFLPEIPKDFQPLRDFRTSGSRPLSTASLFIIREIQQKQAWISELNQDDGEPKVEFIGRFSIRDNPVSVANDILRTLEISPPNYTQATPIREWIDKAESKGIFVSRTSFIHSRLTLNADEFQGFAIADPHAPFIFVNSGDWDAPQLFTLVHEIAHLWIAATGISNHVEPTLEPRDLEPTERFCNEVAAYALIPTVVLDRFPPDTYASKENVSQQARRVGVSSFALLVRAYRAKKISLDEYRDLKAAADREFRAFVKMQEEKKAKQKAAESSGGPNYYLIQVNRNSRLFTQTVLNAYRVGDIEPTQASALLNVRVNKFSKLEEQLYR